MLTFPNLVNSDVFLAGFWVLSMVAVYVGIAVVIGIFRRAGSGPGEYSPDDPTAFDQDDFMR